MSDYSLTKLLNDLVAMQSNSLEIINALSSATTSTSDTVEVKLLDTTAGSTGALQSVTIPSFNYIKNQIQVLNETVKSLSGIGDGNSNVRLSDGSFRKILVSNLSKEASTISNLETPSNFNKKENWFFESFLNPLLYVSFNLGNQLKANTENVEVSRYILNLDSSTKLSVFNNNLLGKNDISFSDFSKIINENNITYFLDKSVIAVSPKSLRYFGTYSVTDVQDETIQVNSALTDSYQKVLSVKLDKLTYNDSLSKYSDTMQLKIGDYLIVNNENKNTRYQIVSFDVSTRTVKLKLVEGFDSITIGSNILTYYSSTTSDVIVDVNIGFGEKCVLFIKGIDPDSKIMATEYSPGVGFYTNELTITDQTGAVVSLSDYYQSQVVDFGAYLYASIKDKTIPVTQGIEPDAPVLTASDFKVFQINEHLNNIASSDIATKQRDKSYAQSEILALDKSISDIRTKLTTTVYSNDQLRKSDESKLNELVNQRKSKSTLYSSLVDEISALTNSLNSAKYEPKYRIRGFFPFPSPKTSKRSGPQEVIQFLIQYRYIGKDGSSNKPQQIEYTDTDGQIRRGTFSNWIEYKTPIREKTIDATTGNYLWSLDLTENADVVNINQLDIPISVGEAVEFRIKSISEAGWPVNPVVSPWSNSIIVQFPTELESVQNINSISEQVRAEKVKTDLLSEFESMNLDQLSSLAFTQNGNFYSSDSKHIASGFLTSENNIISLFDKLLQLDTEIKELRGLIQNAKGNLSVSIIDEYGQEYKIERNKVLKLYAGNYIDELENLTIKKGAIITKTYLIKLVNDAASNLELYSRMFGSQLVGVTGTTGDTDYITERRYHDVPIGISKTFTRDDSNKLILDKLPRQSGQVKGQFIYNRFNSIDGTKPLYEKNDPFESYPYLQTAASGEVGFVWDPTSTSLDYKIKSSDLLLNKFYIHINHPEIQSWIAESTQIGVSVYEYVKKYVKNSVLARSTDPLNYWKQTKLTIAGDPIGATNGYFSKICFTPNDRYLIGQQTVGAYLFLNPNSHDDLVVNGTDALSTRTLKYGNSSSITIPLVFQYRMTDYYGDGDSGIGHIAGDPNFNKSNNLEYTKRIGLDIYNNLIDKDRFSFDVEITASYNSTSMSNTNIITRSFENVIEDLTNVVRTINPTLNKPTSNGKLLN